MAYGAPLGGQRTLQSAPFPVEVAEADPRLFWLVGFRPERRWLNGNVYPVVQRVMDLSLVALSLPLSVPLFVICPILIRLESPAASALFVQDRTGLHGRRFRMFKFRTMVPEAEELKKKLAHLNTLRWPDFKIVGDDPRITRVGRVLRKTSLDELPQLINILRGDMSWVGPRPTSFSADTYEDWQRARLAVRPGLTGLWQITGRAQMEFDERVRLDLAYIERQCLALDLQILVRTVGTVLAGRGAF